MHMTVHLKPPELTVVEPLHATSSKPPREAASFRFIDWLLLPFIHCAGGDSRAFEQRHANVAPLVALGMVNVCVSVGSAALLDYSVRTFFSLEGAAATAALAGAATFGLIAMLVNSALFHGQFQAFGVRQLSSLRP